MEGLIYLAYAVGIAFGIFSLFGSSIEKYFIRRKKTRELQIWLENEEPLQRDLHVYPEDWVNRRKFVAQREKYHCQSCKRVGELGFHVHHILPLKNGGTNALDNLAYLCQYCHENQHDHMLKKRIERENKYTEIQRKTYWKNYWEKKRRLQNQ